MKTIVRHPFARTVLLVAAMATAYWLGREHIVALAGQRATQAKRAQSAARQEVVVKERVKEAAMHPGGQFKLGDAIITANSLNHCCINGVDVDELMAKDPDAALELLKTLPLGDTTQWIYAWAFRYAMQQDADKNPALAEKLAKLAMALPQKPLRLQAEDAIAEAWSGKDPNGALKWALGLPPGDAPTLKTVLGFLAGTDGAFAAQYVNNIQDATVRNEAIHAVISAWGGPPSSPDAETNPFASTITANTPAELDAQLKWLGQVANGSTYVEGVDTILYKIAQINGDPQDKSSLWLSLLQQVTDPANRKSAMMLEAEAMSAPSNSAASPSTEDDSAALNWLQTQPAGDGAAGQAMGAEFSTWMRDNPDAAMSYFQSANNATLVQDAEPIVAVHLSESDPAAAISWANNLPAGDGKWQTIGTLAAGLDEDNATTLLKPLAASLAQDADSPDAVETATEIASEFSENQNDPIPRMSNLANWVQQLPAGKVQDAAAEQYVQETVADPNAFNAFYFQDKDALLSIASAISDGPARDAAVQAAVLAIANADPAAAAQAAQKANISPAERQMLTMLILKWRSP